MSAAAAYAVRSGSFIHDTNVNLTSNLLTSEQRAAIRKSNRKAEQVLGVTLTRDVSAFENNFGLLMATIGAKRSRSRQPSNVTFVGTLKDFGVKMMGLDGRKKQRCADESRSYHQPIVLRSAAGSTSSLERRYSSTATSDEDYDDGHEDGSDLDKEYLTEPRRTSVGIPTIFVPPSLPFLSDAAQDDVPANYQSRSPLAPLITDDTTGSLSHHFGRRHSLCLPPKRCNFIPSFRRDDASETCSSPESEYFVPQSEDFQWDFPDPFNTPTTDPTYAFVMARYAKMHLGDNIAPHQHDDSKFGGHLPFANLRPPPPPSSLSDCESETVIDSRFHTPIARLSLGAVGGGAQLGTVEPTNIPSRLGSPQDGYDSRASRNNSTSSDDPCSFALLRADLEYVNAMLRAQETREAKEAITEEIRRREKRARLRSHLKKIAVLGEEARAVVTTAA
ncbi:hypothetical protein M404DRAFT_1002748 [Pisolithus tinctorius Marx 270]|uniref:Uncharacterized protein n=1 Tax=Pisolithus tinctorius Marx 270 TaxID=870435 RepID=A0A0C3IYW4_PISTI|nr:hypothetical protein M404DRAFT_1002748 [Pisolithus tinctorius Marx 270]